METNGMARRSKQEYLRTIHTRYRQAERAEKTMMLGEFTQVCGDHRKYALGCSTGRCRSRHVLGGSRGGPPGTARQ